MKIPKDILRTWIFEVVDQFIFLLIQRLKLYVTSYKIHKKIH